MKWDGRVNGAFKYHVRGAGGGGIAANANEIKGYIYAKDACHHLCERLPPNLEIEPALFRTLSYTGWKNECNVNENH